VQSGKSSPAPPRSRGTENTLVVLRPVLAAGIAAVLIYASVDRAHAWTLILATAAIALVGWALVGQLGRLQALEQDARQQARQLTAVTDVVTALNSSTHLGGTLGPALDRLLPVVQADGMAVWLPSPDGGRMVLIEERGLPAPEREGEVLTCIRAAMNAGPEALRRHSETLPGAEPSRAARCFTVRMGGSDEQCGYLTAFRWDGDFTDAAVAVLKAVGSDIGGALRSVRMVSDARKLGDRDPVTGLLNHRSAYQRLQQELERHQQAQKPLALLMMDLDNFKLFNDTYGHAAGDEVLKRVTGVLQRSCREEDTVARFGADEFMMLLPNTTVKEAVKAAGRIQSALAKERFRCQDSASLPIGFSYGISVCPDDAADVLDLVSVADANLFESRAQGGNRITASGATSADSSLVYVKGYDLFRAMVVAIDNKDGYTRKHSDEVTDYSLQIAKGLGLGEEMLQTIQIAGMLHDVGKIGVPDTILRKPGKLTDDEFDVMKQHPMFGALIVAAMPGMEEVVHGVRHHHERYDGRGYPDRLAGEQIPLIGRIMAIADAYSAMTTNRPYRKGMTERQALNEIRLNLGTQFDPKLGELFIRLREGSAASSPAAKPRKARAAREPELVEA
jgi:diguanylate cyclase (GGDEF)-like protein